MTSANVIEYRIERDGSGVGHHRVNVMCKEHWEELLKFEPFDQHTIAAYGYDEEEEYWEEKPISLLKFLKDRAVTNTPIREKLAEQGIVVQSLQDWFKENKHKIKSHQTKNVKRANKKS
jgi:hypothetical protein